MGLSGCGGQDTGDFGGQIQETGDLAKQAQKADESEESVSEQPSVSQPERVSKTKIQAQEPRYVPIDEIETYNPEIITQELLDACQLPELDKAGLPYWTGCILENKISVNYGRDSEWDSYTAGNWYWNEQEIKYLADNGFNCVRAVYSLSFLSDPEDMYSINVSELEQVDELISWCIKYNVHLILAQTGLPGKWNLDGDGWREDFDYWNTQENVGGNPELFVSQEVQKAYRAYYDMLAKRYQDIPNGVLSFELATEGTLPDGTEDPSAL
ncbi:MAG: cellulase family glycosylhydrolase [Roseburia sp.]|nr:cellulase family glycosylhydrolase [Roseburia sp.]